MGKIAWRKLLLPAVISLVAALAFVLLLLSASVVHLTWEKRI